MADVAEVFVLFVLVKPSTKVFVLLYWPKRASELAVQKAKTSFRDCRKREKQASGLQDAPEASFRREALKLAFLLKLLQSVRSLLQESPERQKLCKSKLQRSSAACFSPEAFAFLLKLAFLC